MSRLIVGLTGAMGSGTSYIAEMLEKEGYEILSLSKVLRER